MVRVEINASMHWFAEHASVYTHINALGDVKFKVCAFFGNASHDSFKFDFEFFGEVLLNGNRLTVYEYTNIYVLFEKSMEHTWIYC